MSQPTVLILGAAGRLGTAAVQAFAGAGWRVLAQRRRAATTALPPRVETLTLPLADTRALAERAAGTTCVVYAVNPPYTRWDRELEPLLQLGLAVTERLGARFMLPGNVYNHGETMPPLLRVDTPERPSTVKGRQRVAMEAELQRRGAAGLACSVIRAGDFYGGGSGGGWFDQIVKSIAAGKLVYPGPLDVEHAWAYLPDLARAFVAVASRPQPGGLLRLHFAGHTLTGRELLAALERAAQRLGVHPAAGWRHGTLPWPLLRLAGLVHPMFRELTRMSYLWRVPHRLDGSALDAWTGAVATTPLDGALLESLSAVLLRPVAAGEPASAG